MICPLFPHPLDNSTITLNSYGWAVTETGLQVAQSIRRDRWIEPLRDFQIKKYPKTDPKILSISPVSVFSASGVVAFGKPLCVYVYLDNLFLGNPLYHVHLIAY
ncbi:hypothetical protein LC586_22755 [Nostoc sp. CHAB 5714]|uniref:Uncharacterized protein n=1 Tax=Nostoc favosum CHAB5714 TaxID=2780399 RepID=A0ABS8ICP6_9NOSO|nr:hypothetical protein [Nostoc favosum CHAB5714]